MTPVDQVHLDGGGLDAPILGDCWRSAIASILSLPRDDVPHFIQDARHDGDAAWLRATQAWLSERGLVGTFWSGPPPGFEGYAIATGPSPRGDWLHCVVVHIATTEDPDVMHVQDVHDPHPDRSFLAGAPVEFFVIEEEEAWRASA